MLGINSMRVLRILGLGCLVKMGGLRLGLVNPGRVGGVGGVWVLDRGVIL